MDKEKLLALLLGLRDGTVAANDLDEAIKELKFHILNSRCANLSDKRALKVLKDIVSKPQNVHHQIFHDSSGMYLFTDIRIGIGLYENPFEGDIFEVKDQNMIVRLINQSCAIKTVPFRYTDVCNHIKLQKATHKALGEKAKDFLPMVLIGNYPVNLNHLKMIMEAYQKDEIELQVCKKGAHIVKTDKGIAVTAPIQYAEKSFSFDRKRYWEYEE